ncbi:MAG: prepilin-type N-terminal cleavage/methylation domain-containing protein [Verrucomicrobiaceae bacterium]|jgi:prepilin-type N-terminal cleavage/methylation domain-containing protein|nr:prepilin-type N-terminal cleavage/methylation domain-containing protein [Verrucomicrobiaceae bacterium]
MKTRFPNRRVAGFTLAEMMIVITIIALLAALTLQGYTYAMRSSKRRVTESTITAIQASLDRYFDKFGEYPEPATPNEEAEILPGKSFNIAGARCLYQALRGDGFDAIKGGENAGGENGASDGNFQDEELPNVMFKDMPAGMWRVVQGSTYILVDGFSQPFQYIKAPVASATGGTGTGGGTGGGDGPVTINTTYDLWSYAEDDRNTQATSEEARDNPNIAAKWIKNW